MIKNGYDELTLEEISGLSDEELQERKHNARNHEVINEEIDLEAYDKAVKREQKQAQQPASLWGKTTHSLKQLFGQSVKGEFEKKLSDIKTHYSRFENKLERVNEMYKVTSNKRKEASQGLQKAEEYFSLCKENYVRVEKQMDRLESELEQIRERTGDRFNPALFEKKEQYFTQKEQLRELKQETNQAMRKYSNFRNQTYALEQHTKNLEKDISEFERQRVAAGIQIDKYELTHEMRFGKDGKSPVQLHNDLGIQMQKMNRFLKQNISADYESGIDKTYSIKMDKPKKDPLVEDWLRISSS